MSFENQLEFEFRQEKFKPREVDIQLPQDKILTSPWVLENFEGSTDKMIEYIGDIWKGKKYEYSIKDTIHGAQYLILPIYYDPMHGHMSALVLVQQEQLWASDSEREKYYLNVYYLSETQRMWRVAYGYKYGGILLKGDPAENFVNAPNPLQIALTEIAKLEKDVPTRNLDNLIPYPYTDYSPDVQEEIASNKLLGKRLDIKSLSLKQPPEKTLEFRDYLNQIKPEEIKWENEEYNPSFDKVIASFEMPAIASYDIDYGRVIGRVFNSKNAELQYVFLNDERGRTWIANIEVRNSRIDPSYGIRSEVVMPVVKAKKTRFINGEQREVFEDVVYSPLQMPPITYAHEIPTAYRKHVFGNYADATDFLNELPLIKEYRERFAISQQ